MEPGSSGSTWARPASPANRFYQSNPNLSSQPLFWTAMRAVTISRAVGESGHISQACSQIFSKSLIGLDPTV